MGRTLQIPHATVHSSLTALAWLAWHSMPKRKACQHFAGDAEVGGATDRDP